MKLSVIVVIVDGNGQLDRCLAALAAQEPPGVGLDVLVPWDPTLGAMGPFAARHPAFRFLQMEPVPTHAPVDSHAGQHELFDARRTVGLLAATGDLVAMLEDRSVPEPGWARAAVRLHAEHRNEVIGGAMASGRDSVLSLADFLCDFYRFQPPFAGGVREYVSYVNICYKRAALDRTRSLWQDGYYDLTVHRALQDQGEELWLAPDLLVRQMRGDGARLAALIGERFAWGRRFAARRLRHVGGGGRLRLALQAPLVPVLLWLRAMRAQPTLKAMAKAVVATPAMLLIFGAWGCGELVGYLTGRG